MKRVNNGFVLIETLIVTVFLMGIFTFLFTNIIPLNARYERTRNYDDVSTVYAVDEIRKMIKKDANFNSLTSGINNLTVVHKDITKCSIYNNKNLCNALLPSLGIDGTNGVNKIILTKYELTQVKNKIENNNLFETDNDIGLKEYIEFLPKFTDSEISQGFRIIIEREVSEGGVWVKKYANLELDPGA